MSGRCVLFAWELGDGLGHVSRLLPLARRLAEAGHRCVFAVRNVENSHKLLGPAGFAMLQAPITQPATDYTGTDSLGSYGDILETVGYARGDRLGPMLAAWDALLESVRPDLMVADFSPTALLAAYGRVPAVTIGDWFTLPPAGLPAFPALRNSGPRVPESRMMAVIAAAQAARGAPAPATMPAIFRCAGSFVITLPELDRYAEHRGTPALGPLAPLPAPVTDETPAVDYFGYLSLGYRFTERVLEALAGSGRTGSLYLRDGTAKQLDQWRARGLVVHDAPQDMREMARRARVIIHHGGLGTVEAAMALGRPQMLVPRHLEQTVNARMIGDMKLATGVAGGGRFEGKHVLMALNHAVSSTELAECTARTAAELARRGPFNGLERLAEFCSTSLGRETKQ